MRGASVFTEEHEQKYTGPIEPIIAVILPIESDARHTASHRRSKAAVMAALSAFSWSGNR